MRLINKDITFIDYPDPNDWASIFYFSGCCNNCINCQNKELQNPEVGKTIIDNVINKDKRYYTKLSSYDFDNETLQYF